MKIHMLKDREKAMRGTALVLAAALVFTSIDLTVFATNGKKIKTQEVITGFAELDKSVAVQLLPVGALESEIVFPDTLTVTVDTKSVEESVGDVTQKTENPTKEDTESEEIQTPEKGTEHEESTDSGENPDTGENTDSGEHTETGENTDSGEGTGTGESTDSGESTGTGESIDSGENAGPEERKGTEEDAAEEEQPAEEVYAVVEEQPVAKAYTAEEEQPPEEEGAAEEVSPAPVETIPPVKSTRETSIHVTWEHNRADSFDSSTLGNHYVYTPVIPEEYRVADGVSLPQISVTIAATGGQGPAELLALLEKLPDPLTYLSTGVENKEIIDREQLAEAREQLDSWLAENQTDDTENKETLSGEEEERLAELIQRLEGLEHIRDTETDCMDLECPYHYPEMIQQRMAEDELPELLTLEDLVEDYGVEPPEENAMPAAAWDTDQPLRAPAKAPALTPHPQTLMVTNDNENNSHTGKADGDIDVSMGSSDKKHPIELAFTLDELPTQSAYLAVKAYDVDEDYGETDYVYLNDDIYLPMDQTNQFNKNYNNETLGYLSGTNNTWNTTVLEIPLEKLKKGKNVISVTVAPPTWIVRIDWMQLVLDGGAADSNIEKFSLELQDTSTKDKTVTVQSLVTIRQKGNKEYATEYTLTQTETGNALDACFGKAKSQEQIALSMPLDSPGGVYKITGILKDPETEEIKATDSFSFYFNQGVGLGPKVSHTLSPDTLTNRDVTITVKAENMPELGITDVKITDGATHIAAENKKYTFTITYKLKGSEQSFLYPVWVDNIDKTAPVLTYTPVTVVEGEQQETVEKLFGEALSVSDNHRLAEKPLTYTIQKDIAALPGKKTIQVTASDAAGNTTTKKCEITVTAKPLELKLGALTAAAGSKDSFELKAVLAHTGGDTIKETGFVWGVMPAPTLEFHNGSAKTASVITTKNGNLTAKATGLTSGVEYYARAYAKVTSDGKEKVYYSEAGQFGFGIPQYGTFSVSSVTGSNGKATFTITRSNGTDKLQMVYYRTVNGSAVGGTHFKHQEGAVYFKEGETSKTVTVTELGVTNAYQSKAGTKYSNADRTYSLELYRVTGGGTIDQARRLMTRTMAKDSSYTVDRSVYTTEKTITHVAEKTGTNGEQIADTRGDQGGKETNVSFLKNRYNFTNYHTSSSFSSYYTDARQQEYLSSTADGWYYRYVLRAYEGTDGYEHAYLGTVPLENRHYNINGKEAAVAGVNGQLWACNFLQPEKGNAGTYCFPDKRTGGGEGSYYPKNSSGTSHDYNGKTWAKLGVGQTCYAYFGATGNGYDVWYVDGLQSFVMVNDEKEPALLGVAPMAGGTYLPGDPITVALVFDEIVDRQNSSLSSLTISTNVGTLSYAGGADTNVLYFTGKVSSAVSLNSDDALKVNSISSIGSIKDMCNLSGTSQTFSGGNTNIKVDATKPALTVKADTSGSLPRHKATITATGADTIRYVWTTGTALPGYGWQTITSGTQLTESRGTAGQTQKWYLHVLATAASGASTHQYKEFTFMNPAITDVSVRAGGATSSADAADVWKSGKYIVVQYAGVQSTGTTLTFDGPKKEVKSITSSSGSANLYVTENGSYTVTLTDTYGNVISKTIEVRKIDSKKPTVTLRSGSSTGADTVYNELIIAVLPEDTGGSGVAKVEYAWTNTTGTPSTSTWKTLTAAADGSYQAQYTAAETSKTAKYLHVRVTDGAGNVSETVKSGPYQVIKKATAAALPSITVTGNPSSWTKSATLTWKAAKGSGTGAGALAFVYTPKGTVTENMTVGSCTVPKNGVYEFMVMDKFGNSMAAEVLVTKIDNEAPKLEALTAASDKPGTIRLTGVTDDHTAVYDQKGNITGYRGSGIRTKEYKMQGESTWTTFTGDSFSVAKNGNYVVRLTDNAGNVSEEYRVEMTGMDVTAPTVGCTVNGTRNGTSGWYLDSNVSVKLTFADKAGAEGGTPSGVWSAAYQWVTDTSKKPATGMVNLDAAAVAAGEYTISLSDYYGTCYLYYKVTDRKGNVRDGFSDQIKKDDVHRLEFTGPDKARPLSAGLPMRVSLTYGPSGGKLTGTVQTEVLAELPAYQGIYSLSGLKKKQEVYTVKNTGTKQIQYYKNAYSDSTACEQKTFYVRQITFDSQGGSSVESQLIWTTYNGLIPGSDVQCAVTEPQEPVREGYTFGGWYEDAECTDSRKFDFDTQSQVMTDKSLFAKWIPNSYRVYYNLSLPDGSVYEPEDMYKTYVHGQELVMPVPSQDGYAFCGWYDNAGYTGTAYTKIGAAEYGDKTCYGYFKDVQKPKLAASVESNVSPNTKGWYNTDQIRIVLSYSDNKGVTNLYGKVDDGGYEEIPGVITKGGTTVTKEYACVEGTHTYTFKAVDAAGNETVTDALTVKLDTIKPVIGDAAFNEGYKNLWNWLIRKDSLEITVPVEEMGSGIESVEYKLIPEDGSTAGQPSVKKASVENRAGYKAVIYINPDFKGKIMITARDHAGNASDTKMIGTDGSGIHGIIVEDNAPEITFLVNGGESLAEEYEKAPTVVVAVKDDENNVISAGLASVAYQIGNSAECVVQEDFTTSIRTEVKFSIPEEKLPAAGADITVKAVDNAGNRAEKKITVRIHTHRAVLVKAVEPTCLAKGNKAYYVCDCGRWYADSSCMTEITLQDVVLPAKGHTETIDPAKEATCMQTGRTQGSHCSVCGVVIKAQTVTPALGHHYSGDYAYDADGHWRVCSRCAALEEKHSHVYDDDKDTICNDCGFERTIKKPEPENKPESKPENKPESKPENKPESKPENKPESKPENQPENKPESKPENKPENKPESKLENQPENKPESKPENKPENKPESKPENQPESKPENQPENKPADSPDISGQPDIGDVLNVPEMTDGSKVDTSGEAVPTGNVQGMADTSTALELGNGTVRVTVVCEEQEYTAGVSDTAAVVRAVLTPVQLQSVAAGENIEIRVDVKDISGNVPKKDKSAIENGMKEYRKEMPDLILGMYVDISLFMKIGEADWNAVTGTEEPIEVVIGIPLKLQSTDREFFIIRSHEGEYTLLTDMDDAPDTVTIHTDRFSAYAIAYKHVSPASQNCKCSLCHICPTFLGICYFVWLILIMAVLLIVWRVVQRNRNVGEKQEP
ncbi:MAG: InlB B-repeat-containing protein [Oscillospiraceae bacterium]